MNTSTRFLIGIIAGCVFGTVTSSSWHYGEERSWPGYCQNGQKQSPIDLSYQSAVARNFIPFNLTNYNKDYPATVTNNGHSVVIRFLTETEDDEMPKITGGGLPDVYVLDQLHFHWQSEHTVDDYRFPLEMHLVHYAEKYKNLDHAVQYEMGAAVLGVLFDLSPDDDEYFVPFIKVMETVEQFPDQTAELPNKLAAGSFIPRDHAGFYRYMGSLTTPTCNEGVIWTVFTNTLPISEKQVKEFENVWTKENSPLTVNYRSIQPLNDRTVYLRVSPIRSLAQHNYKLQKISWTIVLLLAAVLYF